MEIKDQHNKTPELSAKVFTSSCKVVNIEDINDVTSKYFLLDYFDKGYTIKNIQRIYESKGLICKSNHKGGK